ncbi:hypothetical protein B0H10DRAFT_1953283 [Mycena sp. CBHHK59/15]|nr:hypothetical protein B0H10DRAFT_1953283 [Mycena sp. CBHHK59/15]
MAEHGGTAQISTMMGSGDGCVRMVPGSDVVCTKIEVVQAGGGGRAEDESQESSRGSSAQKWDGRDPANTYIQEAAHSDQRWHIRRSLAHSPAYVPCFNSRTAHSDAGLPSWLALVQARWSKRSVKQSGVRMREKNTWDSNCRWFEKHQTDEDPAKHPTYPGPTMPRRASAKSKSHLQEVEWAQDMCPPSQHNICGTQSAGHTWRSAKVPRNTLHPHLHGIESHEISRSGADDSLASVLLPPSTRMPPPSRLCPILPTAHPLTLSETAQRLKRNHCIRKK